MPRLSARLDFQLPAISAPTAGSQRDVSFRRDSPPTRNSLNIHWAKSTSRQRTTTRGSQFQGLGIAPYEHIGKAWVDQPSLLRYTSFRD
jgi:hypothetical protein